MPHSTGWGRRKDRRTGDPAPIGEIIDGLLQEQVFARGLTVGRLAVMWPEVVGERLARATAPAELEDGVLTVAASDSIWGAQARFLNEEIRAKANDALGTDAVRRVHVLVRPDLQNRR
jgi:predicted nucleic acid-binding Zn ribbon protein